MTSGRSRRASLASIRRWWGTPTAPLVVIAAAQLAIHLALNGAYGLHTDELYYIVGGRHPALGYVDCPPVTPLLARLNTSIFRVSPWTLRLFPALTSAATVLLTGLCARELGANRGLSAFASLVALVSPYLLATWLFQTVEFDEVLWLLAIFLLLRILRTRTGRLFPVLGLVLGVGLETKTTILALCIAMAATVLISSDLRPTLRTRYPLIGLAIAVACAVPNSACQAANGFPTLTYVASHRSDMAQSGGIGAFIELFILLVGPLLLPFWIAGLALLTSEVKFRSLLALVVIPIGRSFGGVVAVDGVSFELLPQQILGIIGPNGAGKTTVFDLLSGLLPAGRGSIRLKGADITRWPAARRALHGLGRSFQDAQLFPSLTVAENLAIRLERHIQVRDHLAALLALPAIQESERQVAFSVADLVELFGLAAFRDKFLGELSTGSRRIVDLAMALAHDPDVLRRDAEGPGRPDRPGDRARLHADRGLRPARARRRRLRGRGPRQPAAGALDA